MLVKHKNFTNRTIADKKNVLLLHYSNDTCMLPAINT